MKNVVLILGPVTKEDAMKSEKYLLYEALKRVQRGSFVTIYGRRLESIHQYKVKQIIATIVITRIVVFVCKYEILHFM